MQHAWLAVAALDLWTADGTFQTPRSDASACKAGIWEAEAGGAAASKARPGLKRAKLKLLLLSLSNCGKR